MNPEHPHPLKHYDDMTTDERNAWALEHVLGWTRTTPAPDVILWTAPDGHSYVWPDDDPAELPSPATDLNDAWMVVQQCRAWAEQGRFAGQHMLCNWRSEQLERAPNAVAAANHICRMAWYGLLAEQSIGLGARP